MEITFVNVLNGERKVVEVAIGVVGIYFILLAIKGLYTLQRPVSVCMF